MHVFKTVRLDASHTPQSHMLQIKKEAKTGR